MDASTLAKVMTVEGHKVTYSRLKNRLYFDKDNGGPSFPATTWMNALNTALVRAKCTTAKRVEMFLAQLGAESGSFRYTEELASGAEYNWRQDLGNTHPGDGERFKGRTYIQITGRHNYASLSKWAHAHGYIPTATYFVDHPSALADVKYIFLGPVWYWTIARNMNAYADRDDIEGATKAVNGGYNNLSGRRARWLYAKKFGDKLLPSGIKPTPPRHAKPVKPAPKPVRKSHHRPKPSPKVVTVRSGDNLTRLADRYNVRGGWKVLQKLNNLKNPNLIFVGQRLRVR